jgi:Protein of unknown function (DUF2442)
MLNPLSRPSFTVASGRKMIDMLRIRSVEVLDDYWLRLSLTDGCVVERNVRALLRGPVFELWRSDYAKFRQARVRTGTVAWPNPLDLDPSVLIWNGASPKDPGARPATRLTLAPARELTPPKQSTRCWNPFCRDHHRFHMPLLQDPWNVVGDSLSIEFRTDPIRERRWPHLDRKALIESIQALLAMSRLRQA